MNKDIWDLETGVGPYTKILTIGDGDVEISSVVGKNVGIWNGERFSYVDVKKSRSKQKLITVRVSNKDSYVTAIECTPNYKFFIENDEYGHIEIEARNLQPNDKLVKFDIPSPATGGWEVWDINLEYKVDSIEDYNIKSIVYYVEESERKMGTFNGIVIGTK